jgi:microcystin-dependent protein
MSTSASLNYTYPMPIGCIIPYLGKNIPDSFLLCDGSTYNISDYPFLNNVLGGIYGSTATTFNVPNTVNKFIEPTSTNNNTSASGSGNASFSFTLIEDNIPILPVTGSIDSLSGTCSNSVMIQSGANHKGTSGSSVSQTYLPNAGAVSSPNYTIDLTGVNATYTGANAPQTITSITGVEPANYSVFYIIKAKP